MSYPYAGDRQLDPDECECPYCGHACGGPNNLKQHVKRCPWNDDLDPDPESEDV